MNEEILVVDRINKSFEGLQALKDVSLSVQEAEILGIIGPNGAGKTTLFNVISGQIKPDSGHIHFKGLEITKLKPHEIVKLGIARTFQIVRPFHQLSVYENILAAYLNRHLAKENENVNESILKLMRDVGLIDKADVQSSYLTIGQVKKLEIARALATNSRLLLLDEPFAGSSMEEISDIIRSIRRAHERGITIIIIEHVLRALMRIVGRVVVLDKGVKIAEGSPTEIASNECVISAYIGREVKKLT
jgi:branched-chain amino acid transport system ATP-binding protein